MIRFNIISIFITVFQLSAQTPKDPRGEQIILSVRSEDTGSFVLYSPAQIAKGRYQSPAQAINASPEAVFEALLSETTFDWTKHNSIGGVLKARKPEYYAKMQNMNKDKNYYSLRCKWLFLAAGKTYSIVKFDFVNQEGNKATGAYTLVLQGKRWYKHETAYTSNICMLFIAFKDEVLQSLFSGKPNSNRLHDALLSKVSTDNGVDLDKLFKEFDSWQKGKDDDKMNYFLDPNSWINQK